MSTREETEAPATRAVRARGVQRRAQIVEAAAAYALEHGIAALSHRQVAAAAKVPLGSTTYYFASLDELRAAAVAQILIGDRERRRCAIGDGLSPDVTSIEFAARLVEVVVSTARLDEPRQVALLYERISEAGRSPELAEVLRTAATEVIADVQSLCDGTAWASADPAALLALTDGRAIGWFALGDTRPQLLIDRLAADLERFRD